MLVEPLNTVSIFDLRRCSFFFLLVWCIAVRSSNVNYTCMCCVQIFIQSFGQKKKKNHLANKIRILIKRNKTVCFLHEWVFVCVFFFLLPTWVTRWVNRKIWERIVNICKEQWQMFPSRGKNDFFFLDVDKKDNRFLRCSVDFVFSQCFILLVVRAYTSARVKHRLEFVICPVIYVIYYCWYKIAYVTFFSLRYHTERIKTQAPRSNPSVSRSKQWRRRLCAMGIYCTTAGQHKLSLSIKMPTNKIILINLNSEFVCVSFIPWFQSILHDLRVELVSMWISKGNTHYIQTQETSLISWSKRQPTHRNTHLLNNSSFNLRNELNRMN